MDKKEKAIKKIEKAYIKIFEALEDCYGLNWKNDSNFNDTPNRIGRSLINERLCGINSYDECSKILTNTAFPTEYNGFVVINPITANSLCPHHFENVSYTVSIAYIPNGKAIGLSKIPRVVKLFASQPLLQEDFTKKITDLIEESIKPDSLGVIVKGQHNCMVARGVKQHNVFAITSAVRGKCLDDPQVKAEFLRLCGY